MGQKVKRIILAAVIIFAATWLFCFDPSTSAMYPPCPFHLITGLYCPGCGCARALHQLLHGNLFLALRYNPFTVLFIFILAGYGIFYVVVSRKRRVFNPVFIRPIWIWVLLAFILLFWISRNITFCPFP